MLNLNENIPCIMLEIIQVNKTYVHRYTDTPIQRLLTKV